MLYASPMRHLPLLLFLVGCPEPEPTAPQPTSDPTPQPTPVPTPEPTPPPEPTPIPTVTLKVVAYNVESGGASSATVADNVATVAGEALWGFSEVQNQSWLDQFEAAADDGGQDFRSILGSTGYQDRLGIVWNADEVTYESHQELNNVNIGGSARAPLVATFVHDATGVRFLFMVNHLWRTNDTARHQQATLLNDWARDQTLPVIAVGDYNFDWAVDGGEDDHDVGYDNLVEDGVFEWVRPDDLVQTQCSYAFDGVLDFVFTANGAQDWASEGDILLRQNVHCQPSDDRPDHRPVSAVFEIPEE